MTRILPILSPEVRDALAGGRGVVALESAIVTHGLPRLLNADTARAVEEAVRSAGAVPATICVLDGRLRVGLTSAELERLARAEQVAKASVRDLPYLLARGMDGGTTVAATVWIAARAGLTWLATGGIGGVHRGAERTFDVSADLAELARSPVATVCSGAKSILDLPRTLEVLESLGVPVAGYGTDTLPTFFSRHSAIPLTMRVDTPAEAAALWRTHRSLDLPGGMVLANPVPQADALDPVEVEAWIATALAEAERRAIAGKSLTPFLLESLRVQSNGRTLKANRSLVLSNASLAARIASET